MCTTTESISDSNEHNNSNGYPYKYNNTNQYTNQYGYSDTVSKSFSDTNDYSIVIRYSTESISDFNINSYSYPYSTRGE
jgi:hypothetical protein